MKYRNHVITLFIILLTSTGSTETINFQVAGKARNCVIHVPNGINKPAVVFFLHGAGGNGTAFENDTKADVVADREKFIAVYPSGAGGNWNYNDGSDDFNFILALIDTIDARYHIDRNRLYVTGFSMGGGMTFALACKYSEIFAAAAPVSAAGSACSPKRKIPLFLTFGTKDMYPPANYMTAINRWVGINGCPSAPSITRPYPSTNSQSKVTRLTYSPCSEGAEIVADSISGGPHEWPMDTRTKVNNSEEVWAFFKNFSLNKTNFVLQHSTTPIHNNITLSYSKGIVDLQGVGEKIQVLVMDIKGRVVTTFRQNQFVFKDKPSGVYVVVINSTNGYAVFRMVIP